MGFQGLGGVKPVSERCRNQCLPVISRAQGTGRHPRRGKCFDPRER
jgi:hypothetical protein